MRYEERRIMRDLAAITAAALELMAEAGLMMREAVALAMHRYGYETADGGGSP